MVLGKKLRVFAWQFFDFRLVVLFDGPHSINDVLGDEIEF
jgi:hypothetical protein